MFSTNGFVIHHTFDCCLGTYVLAFVEKGMSSIADEQYIWMIQRMIEFKGKWERDEGEATIECRQWCYKNYYYYSYAFDNGFDQLNTQYIIVDGGGESDRQKQFDLEWKKWKRSTCNKLCHFQFKSN